MTSPHLLSLDILYPPTNKGFIHLFDVLFVWDPSPGRLGLAGYHDGPEGEKWESQSESH